ncbi:phage baseplate assembly protein V [Deferribacter autotrophicus]|uniref:Phage baseplate assembly protein V n=1 Tax=Deferribacter autotrophicus TaxID=500465 RepID=A0A5A8F6F2_9BACT|nr:phage baseplate assembly protein V [Deferribacter autotrophicus]KAA0257218.1 phage baseplate assembly protein V [Deferribacter autotrophicus]
MLELLKELEFRIRKLEIIQNSIVRLGKVTNRYPDKNRVRVEFQGNDKIVSYELEVLHPKTKDDKFYFMPDIDEYVLCVFLPYAPSTGFVVGAYYDKNYTPPVSNNDEFYVKFSDGTEIFYDRKQHLLKATVKGDIDITAVSSHFTTITTHDGDITINGNVVINGNLQTNGNIQASQQIRDLDGVSGSLSDLRKVYNEHTHQNGDASKPPVQQV